MQILNIIRIIYYILANISLIAILCLFFKKYLNGTLDATAENCADIQFPNVAYKDYSGIIVVTRLPDPYSPLIRKRIVHDRPAFMMWSEYSCGIETGHYSEFDVFVFGFDTSKPPGARPKNPTPKWFNRTENIKFSDKNRGNTFHIVCEIWSDAYIDLLSSAKTEDELCNRLFVTTEIPASYRPKCCEEFTHDPFLHPIFRGVKGIDSDC
jgi:hypothetical protein